MVKPRMEGRRIPDQEIHNMKERMDFDRTALKKESAENFPTMQNGYNEDMTIREEKIKPFVHEIDEKGGRK